MRKKIKAKIKELRKTWYWTYKDKVKTAYSVGIQLAYMFLIGLLAFQYGTYRQYIAQAIIIAALLWFIWKDRDTGGY